MATHTVRIAVLHAYSAENAGDGLLVGETLRLLEEALGACEFTVVASDPDSFDLPEATLVGSKPTLRGFPKNYLGLLRRLDEFDLVVGVGGGYQRGGHLSELLKYAIVHGPQLVSAARSGTPSVYMPQSIGPFAGWVGRIVASLLRSIDRVYVRDDRSIVEVSSAFPVRSSDLALLSVDWNWEPKKQYERVPVVTVRRVRGSIPEPVLELAKGLGTYDGYVQSTVGGNDDRSAVASLKPRRLVERADLLNPGGPLRVVVAMRLHAALMAMQAGHVVVHLAYERKGFGAFADLGVESYVHSAFRFDVDRVADQVRQLVSSADARSEYRQRVEAASFGAKVRRAELVADIRELVAG